MLTRWFAAAKSVHSDFWHGWPSVMRNGQICILLFCLRLTKSLAIAVAMPVPQSVHHHVHRSCESKEESYIDCWADGSLACTTRHVPDHQGTLEGHNNRHNVANWNKGRFWRLVRKNGIFFLLILMPEYWFSTGMFSIKRGSDWLRLETEETPQNGQNVHGLQVTTPSCHILPVSRVYRTQRHSCPNLQDGNGPWHLFAKRQSLKEGTRKTFLLGRSSCLTGPWWLKSGLLIHQGALRTLRNFVTKCAWSDCIVTVQIGHDAPLEEESIPKGS